MSASRYRSCRIFASVVTLLKYLEPKWQLYGVAENKASLEWKEQWPCSHVLYYLPIDAHCPMLPTAGVLKYQVSILSCGWHISCAGIKCSIRCHCLHIILYQHNCSLNDFDFFESATPYFGWLWNYNIVEIQSKQQCNRMLLHLFHHGVQLWTFHPRSFHLVQTSCIR